jgi:hypothetical protein
MSGEQTTQFRRRARQFRLAATLAIAAIAGVILLTLIVILTRWNAFGDTALVRLALTWTPAIFYLWALWALRSMFAAFAGAGPAFTPIVANALTNIGWALLSGAAVTLVLAPFVLTLAHSHAMGGFAIFNVPALTIAIVGLALIATAHMLRRAAEIEAQAAALKSELEEFF